MSKHNSKLIIRITILGDKGTGKTTFMKTYVGDDASANTEADISGSAYSFDTVVDDTNILLKILDSDGKHIAVTAWAHGVVVIYSTDNIESFVVAEQCISDIKEVTMRDALIVVVANHVGTKKRIISTEDGEQLSARYNCSYIELSALNDKSNVSNVFYELSQQILIRRGLKHTSLLKKPPQIFRRMVDAVTRRGSRTLSEIKESPPPVRETII